MLPNLLLKIAVISVNKVRNCNTEFMSVRVLLIIQPRIELIQTNSYYSRQVKSNTVREGWGSEAVCSDKISHLHKMRSSLAQSFNGTRTSIYSARSSNQVMVSCTGIKMEWLPLALLHKGPYKLKGGQNSSSARLLLVASKTPVWLVEGFLVLLSNTLGGEEKAGLA